MIAVEYAGVALFPDHPGRQVCHRGEALAHRLGDRLLGLQPAVIEGGVLVRWSRVRFAARRGKKPASGASLILLGVTGTAMLTIDTVRGGDKDNLLLCKLWNVVNQL